MNPLLDVNDRGDLDPALRPRRFAEFVGQGRIVDNLRVYVRAALARGEALDHVLLAGPPGLGKTSLAQILGEELGVPCTIASGPTLERKGDLAAVLSNLEPRQVLFIDEIHRMPRAVEEVLYPAMEDYQLDVILGSGPAAHSVRLPLSRFTLVGATTRTGLLTSPLRARFGIHCTFDFYRPDELERILIRAAEKLGVVATMDGLRELASRSRGTPRVATRLLRRVRDFAQVEGDGTIDGNSTRSALNRLDIDPKGLDSLDQRILETIEIKFSGGPVGLDTLAAALGESKDTIEDASEPYLLQLGFLQRTPRGRMLTPAARAHLGLPPRAETDDPQTRLIP